MHARTHTHTYELYSGNQNCYGKGFFLTQNSGYNLKKIGRQKIDTRNAIPNLSP